MEIRLCSPADLELVRQRWPLAGDVHGSHFFQADSDYLIAWDGEDPVGSGVVRWSGPVGGNARAHYGSVPALLHLHVREAQRGRGIGTALIEAAEALVRRHGHSRLVLAVGLENPDAERLYRRLGYQPTGVTDVTEYDWLEDTGRSRHAIEADQLLIRVL